MMLANKVRIISVSLLVALVIFTQGIMLFPTRAEMRCPTFTDESTTAGDTKFNTAKSQMWFNDGIWWGAFSDNDTGVHFYSLSNNALAKGPIIDENMAGIPDALWDDTNLFILVWKSVSLSTLYKYSYDSASKTYALIDGFPIDLLLDGGSTSAIVLAEDSTGKLWATYTGTQGSDSDGKIHVIWSASVDHKVWDTTGTTLEVGLTPDKTEISAITHFDGNKIGIAWSNQPQAEIAFRYHIDGEDGTAWSAKEIIDSGLGPRGLGPVADDHLSMKAAPDGRIFLVAKDNDNDGTSAHAREGRIWLYIREVVGDWGHKTIVQPDFSQLPARPQVLLDVTNNEVYVIYHDEAPSANGRNFIVHTSMDNPSFDFPCVFTITPSSNATSTKQNLTWSTGLMAAFGTGGSTDNIVFRGVILPPPNPTPTLGSLSRNSATLGDPAFTLTVDGSDFVNGSVVKFNGSNRPTTFVNGNQLTAQIAANDLQAAGVFLVTVANPAPGGGSSTALYFTVNNPSPTLGSLSKNSATMGDAGFTLTLDGSGFVNESVVRFNGSQRPTTFVNGGQLTAQITAADLQVAGVFLVTASNPGPGGGSSNAFNFTVNNPVPTLSTILPTNKVAGDGAFTLTVNGTNYNSGSIVRFNGSDRLTTFVNSTQLNVQIPAADVASAGTFSITVSNPAPGGGASGLKTLTVENPPVTVFNISPTGKTAGDTSFTLTVNGNNFNSSSIIRFNGSDRPTTLVNARQLTAQIPTADLAHAGIFPIIAFNPAPGGGSSDAFNFTVSNPAPTLSSISKNTATAGDTAFTLTVNGSGFVNGSVVKFNGAARPTTFVNGSQLTAQITASDLQVAGVFAITAASPAPGGGSSSALNFTVNNPSPTLGSLSQNGATVGDAPFTVTVNGSGFVDGSVLKFNGSDRPTTFINGNQLTAQITAGDLQVAGVFAVTVANSGPGGGSSSGFNFTVNNPAPTLSSISQNSATVGDAAFTLTVNGSGFVNGSLVRFNGSERPANFVSATQLSTQITAADIQAAGIFPIAIANPSPGGGTSSAVNFTVNNPAPTLASISPASKTAGGEAFTLTVNGGSFVNRSVVRWNGADRITTFVSSTQLNAQIAAADIQTAGVASVGVFNPSPAGGSSSARSLAVTNANPTLNALSPGSVLENGPAFTLTVNGTGFSGNSVVRFGGSARPTTFISGTQLRAQITAADIRSAGLATIAVFNPTPGGGLSNPLSLTIDTDPALHRFLRVVGTTFTGGQNNAVKIELDAQGDENALGFSLSFDTSKMSFSSAAVGGGASTATLNVNQSQAVNGRIGLALALPAGQSFTAGTRHVVLVTFNVPVNSLGATALAFEDQPVPREMADSAANTLGGNYSGGIINIQHPAPLLGAIAPDSVTAGGSAFVLTLNGSKFIDGSIVKFNGSNRTTTSVNSDQLLVQIAAADIALAGTFPVTVFNPGPGGGTSGGVFTVSNPAPTLSSISQTSATVGDAAFTLTVHGSGFVNGSVVRWNDAERSTIFLSRTELMAQVAASDIQSVGNASVTVFNSAPGGGPSNALNFATMNPPAKVQFSAANYGMAEDKNSIQITVNRTGDTSTTVTVDYATNDSFIFIPCIATTGASSQRCDYAIAAGTLTFAPGETSKAFTLLLINDAYVDGNETFRLALSNVAGATLGTQGTASVTILDNDTVLPTSNPIDDARFFVNQHYIDLLNRLPNQGGLNYWTNEIAKCGSDAACIQSRRIGVSAAFFIEREFQETGFVVHRLYKAAYGQRPNYPQFMPDRSQLIGGPQLQSSTLDFANRFVNRAEFKQAYPESMTAAQFINKLYDTAGLAGSAKERAQAIEAMTKSSKTRAESLLDLIEINEFKTREYNPAFVLMQYFGYLRRDPDLGGYHFWLNVLNNKEPENYRGMVCSFITSREYQERFSSVVTRSNQECGP
jgi:Calx-beta domain-containing protein/IPT/TIG domain-containing protein/uncharacterized protein DUF4214